MILVSQLKSRRRDKREKWGRRESDVPRGPEKTANKAT